ncbi:metal-dependent hydrolase [Alicyclobacillus dauci]|uniref:Metal-dependent hydrolase n=1 Tax=Alicyclobacillus dauci TaxID=1475485 RepID=A0ABY6Z3Y7_9BACL|nr:metal-dependent hydrolase [Alicyclobacillus dauci]WAH37464.1 metal-dependent hydrolase [Alicyclobacillus dauci]
MLNRGISITWLGFAGVYIKTPGNKTILVDPWITNNPLCPSDFKDIDNCDYIFLTHAHRDHAADAEMLAKKTGAEVLAGWELAQILMRKGVQNVFAINKGGTRHFGDISVTAVHADHSSAFIEGDQLLYGGEAMGYVIRFENGFTIYHAGDTNVFGDMALIAELYEPELALLPIGDVLTMSPKEAAKAVRLLKVKHVVPTHFGYDFLTGTPAELAARLEQHQDVIVYDIKPGDTVS